MAKTFAWSGERLPTLEAFQDYVNKTDLSWAVGLTYHHSWRPLPAQWRGSLTMNALKQDYMTREDGTWDSGPHLFVASGSPDPNNDGFWIGTPLSRSGIHAGKCNSDHIGIEIIGDYDYEPWQGRVRDWAYGVGIIILNKLGKSPNKTSVTGHRECLNNKSCPGNAINMDVVRAELSARMALPAGTFPVSPMFLDAWTSSGGVWKGTGILTPGYAISEAFSKDGMMYQNFQRATARLKNNHVIEWLFKAEQP